MNDKRNERTQVTYDIPTYIRIGIYKIIYPVKGNWQYFFGKLFKILIIEIKMKKKKANKKNAKRSRRGNKNNKMQ